ncbi:MAG: hypothetical protein M1823_002065 [Watsoniomyces obsoletus]|nr:MAG: hypothetical protein M1823_002065 [Watsoniomyces obsoletus]
MATKPKIIDLSLDTPIRQSTRPKVDTNADFIVLSSDGGDSASKPEKPPQQQQWEDPPPKRRKKSISPDFVELSGSRISNNGPHVKDTGISNARLNTTRPRGESSGPDHDLPRLPRAGLRRVKTVALDGSDPMPWSSSPLPEIFDDERDKRETDRGGRKEDEDFITGMELSKSGMESSKDVRKPSLPQEGSGLSFSERTLAILANLNEDDSLVGHGLLGVRVDKKSKGYEGNDKPPNRRRSARLEALEEEGEEENSQELPTLTSVSTTTRSKNGTGNAATTTSKKSSKPTTDPEKLSKQEAKLRREQEKQAEKERKQHLKEQKGIEKQRATELAQANRSKTDKKASTPEMIVDLPESYQDNNNTGNQIQNFLQNLGVQIAFYTPSPSPSVSNVVKWRRKVTAEYNPVKGYWEPVAEYIKEEMHALCIMTAQEFVNLACVDGDGQDLNAHVLRFKSHFEGYQLLYLIEGLEKWMRKNKNLRNRAYQAAVLAAEDEEGGDAHEEEGMDGEQQGSVTQRGRRKPKQKDKPKYVDEDVIEDALLRLQVMHGCFVHHTSTVTETAEWIGIFTQHVSTIPYK